MVGSSRHTASHHYNPSGNVLGGFIEMDVCVYILELGINEENYFAVMEKSNRSEEKLTYSVMHRLPTD